MSDDLPRLVKRRLPRTEEAEPKSMVQSDGPLVAFVHVPKTAGATVTSMFVAAHSKTAVQNAGNYLRSPEKAEAKISRPRTARARLTVGHVPYGVFREHLPENTRYMTFLREPVDRVLSIYYGHIHRRGDWSDERRPVVTDSIEEALEMGLPEINDLATRFLCGHQSPLGELPASAFEDAKANLREFAFVGIQERFDESAALLQRTFGLGRVAYESRHIDSDRPAVDEIPDEQRALIADHNQLDAELYAFARGLFEAAVAGADEGLGAEAETLRSASAAANAAALSDARDWLDKELPVGATKPLPALRAAAAAAGISPIALRYASWLLAIERERDEEGQIWMRTREAQHGPPRGRLREMVKSQPHGQRAGPRMTRERSQAPASVPGRARNGRDAQNQARMTGGGQARTSPPTAERDTRFAFFEQARDHTPYLGVETDGGRFMVAAADRGVGRSLFVKRGRPELRVLRQAVSVVEILVGPEAIAGRPFVDVGANIGTTTIPALVSHRFGSAVACEPGEESYLLLRANLALNGLETHVCPLPVAASNRIGRSSFVLTEDRSGASWVATSSEKIAAAEAARAARIAEDPTVLTDPKPRAPGEVSEMKVVEVELVTLDHLADAGVIDRDRLGMLWIDAEGHEGHILEGAATLADRGVPIVFEFNPAGLDERGDRDKIDEVADRSYTHFVDVRRSEPDPSHARFRLQPVAELAKYAERFLDPSTPGHFTDLLLLRLDNEQATLGANLPQLMSPESQPSTRQRE